MSGLTRALLLNAGVTSADVPKVLASKLLDREVGHLLMRPEVGEQLVLGYDANVPLVVDAGQVLALDGTRRPVNATVAAFVDVLGRYAEYVLNVVDAAGAEEGTRLARQAVAEMRRIDPAAFETADSYWSIVCEQMLAGNL